MKAMEAPKKIYLTQLMLFATPTISSSDNDVEYIRTDAFIKKACAWLENNLQGIVGGSIYIDDFRKYMKGE